MTAIFCAFALLLAVAGNSAVNAEPSEQLVKLARANDDFGLQLLHRLELEDKAKNAGKQNSTLGNVFISPFSVSTVLAMLMAGGANKTFEELRNTLGFDQTIPESDIYTNYNTLFEQLKSAISTPDKKNELKVANSIALQDKLQLLQSYLDVTKKNFDSKVFSVDFATKAQQATEEINQWVSEKTSGKIAKLFDDDLGSDTLMVLLNAIYFRGSWKYPFDKEETEPGPFHVTSEKSVQVAMMALSQRRLNYAQFDDGQLLELPYEGDALSMLIFLPNQTDEAKAGHQSLTSQFAQDLTKSSDKLATRLAALRKTSVDVELPKFKIEGVYSLKPTLLEMGIQEAFTAGADFSRINGGRDLMLSAVHHKTFLQVDEIGSEAAGVTGAVIIKKTGIMPRWFAVNRPFVLLIRDNTNQLTLFAGVVNKP